MTDYPEAVETHFLFRDGRGKVRPVKAVIAKGFEVGKERTVVSGMTRQELADLAAKHGGSRSQKPLAQVIVEEAAGAGISRN